MGKSTDNKQRLIEKFLSNKKNVTGIVIVYDLVIFFLFNYLINIFFNLPIMIKSFSEPAKYMGIQYIFPQPSRVAEYIGFYGVVLIIYVVAALILDAMLIYKLNSSFSDNKINVNQKGEERWTTNEEIKEQYKEIPDRDKAFQGYGGTIISRMEDKLYIDESPTNNLVIGITRSGKGEMFVYPSIDVYSRAEKKTSMVVCDPKLELYKGSKETLEKRGYDVYLLNLDDPLHSMGFNPLEQIKAAYLEKEYADAELLAQAFSYSIFNPNSPTNTDAFWQDTASSLLSALILAHIEDCVKADELLNDRRYRMWKLKRDRYEELDQEAKKKAKEKLNALENPADVIMDERITCLPGTVKFELSDENSKKINMYSIINTFTELVRMKDEDDPDITALDAYFNKRPALNRAKLKYAGIEVAGAKTKGGIFASMLAKLTIFTYENIAKMTAESSLRLEDIGFGKRPVAVFMGIPDYDKSTHFLATVFIRQTYFVLAKKATRSMTGKCPSRVKIIADEFGNIPAIEAMESIITVCLGRNISFDLFIQAYSQLTKLYGDDAETIKGNCGNQIYILTNDKNTAQDFSDLIGNETIIDVQRSGERLSLKKHFTESTIDKPLLNMNQLMKLQEGECVVKRVMKRKDLKGNRIEPTPIFNSEESGKRFLLRYEYLTDTFPNPDTIDLNKINSEDRGFVILRERVWDYEQTFAWFINEQKGIRIRTSTVESLTNKEQIKETVMKLMDCSIGDDMQITRLVDEIEKADIKKDEREALLSLIRIGSSAV